MLGSMLLVVVVEAGVMDELFPAVVDEEVNLDEMDKMEAKTDDDDDKAVDEEKEKLVLLELLVGVALANFEGA